MANAHRTTLLAKIHVAKRDMALSEEVYRDILQTRHGVQSAASLSLAQMKSLIQHFKRLGWQTNSKPDRRPGTKPGSPVEGKRALLSKIEAQLAEVEKPWAYADGIARRVCKVDLVAWCTPAQLRKIVAALNYDAQRRGRTAK